MKKWKMWPYWPILYFMLSASLVCGGHVSSDKSNRKLNELSTTNSLTAGENSFDHDYENFLFEGDIILPVTTEEKDKGFGHLLRNAMRNEVYKWPNARVPYSISSSFSEKERGIIAEGMGEFHRRTCIRFLPRRNEKEYIFIRKGGGCSSSVGRQRRRQNLNLGLGCVYKGVVMHELMHAIGFWHEQSRADRDSYITIVWSNIKSSMRHNFLKYNWDYIQSLGVSYDTGSIMHYGPTAFSVDRRKPTIIPKDKNKRMGQREAFSKKDVEKINRLYGCYKGSGNKPAGKCEDTKMSCHAWVRYGLCETRKTYMKSYCAKGCGFCGVASACKDKNKYCQIWSKDGFCKITPIYMDKFCPKSCGKCF